MIITVENIIIGTSMHNWFPKSGLSSQIECTCNLQLKKVHCQLVFMKLEIHLEIGLQVSSLLQNVSIETCSLVLPNSLLMKLEVDNYILWSGGCPRGVWGVSERCLRGVWEVSGGVSGGCLGSV